MQAGCPANTAFTNNKHLGPIQRRYDYDARGNLIEERRGKGDKLATQYHYNLANQLVAIEKDGQRTDYRYAPLGRRIKKRDTFGSTRYLWADDP
ncbi:hypothetical protein [Marinimicrobium alkaliphilum]|uniref:hypothetical protein n=1 Tax=Marinimicrobium alkaliphilum TaxID=2202654 RepID=UPI000DB90E7A|nr:hypothetical protein [Marinimicrobium alkaliphilum]